LTNFKNRRHFAGRPFGRDVGGIRPEAGDEGTAQRNTVEGASMKPDDIERLRRAYETGPGEKEKGISDLAERYGLTGGQVRQLAFKNGFTKLGEKNGKLEVPPEVEEILQQASGLGRQATQMAINRALRVLLQYPRGAFPHMTRALLWRLSRKYKAAAKHRPYQRARWSADDVELLANGYHALSNP
jgi:hypothetical protein